MGQENQEEAISSVTASEPQLLPPPPPPPPFDPSRSISLLRLIDNSSRLLGIWVSIYRLCFSTGFGFLSVFFYAYYREVIHMFLPMVCSGNIDDFDFSSKVFFSFFYNSLGNLSELYFQNLKQFGKYSSKF